MNKQPFPCNNREYLFLEIIILTSQVFFIAWAISLISVLCYNASWDKGLCSMHRMKAHLVGVDVKCFASRAGHWERKPGWIAAMAYSGNCHPVSYQAGALISAACAGFIFPSMVPSMTHRTQMVLANGPLYKSRMWHTARHAAQQSQTAAWLMGGEASVACVTPKGRRPILPEATDEGSPYCVIMIKYCHLLACCVSRLRLTHHWWFSRMPFTFAWREGMWKTLG